LLSARLCPQVLTVEAQLKDQPPTTFPKRGGCRDIKVFMDGSGIDGKIGAVALLYRQE